MRASRRIVFDWQLVPFVVSAVIGAFIAYNPPSAWIRFALIALGVVVYLLFANLPDAPDKRSTLKIVLAVLPSIIAVWFVLTNDWSRDTTGKLSILHPVLNVLASLRVMPGVPQINPNVIGGAIAALLPLQVKALQGSRRADQVILIGLSLIGLVLSETRGAWLALLIVMSMWALWKFANQRMASQRKARIVWITFVLIGSVIGLALIIVTPIGLRLIGASGDRPNIWRNSLDLVSDYPITGFGLGDFEMTYSTYALLVHVGHTMHAHDLWLNVWLEQGLLGIMALAGLVLNAIWPKPSSPWRMAALAALAVMLLHSLADDPFYGAGVAIPLVFIPLGLLARPNVEVPSSSSRFQPAFIVWGPAAIGLVVGLILPGGRAIFEANLGTVAQTRAELSVYHWPDTPIQDALRRSGDVDLTAAIAHYRAALALDPANASANRRLGQIELSRGNYDSACTHLQTAYQVAPQQRATRQLLGECYALNDSADRAVELWRTIDLGQSQLDIRQWWYGEYLADHDRAAKLKQAIDALNNQWTIRSDGSTYQVQSAP